MRHFVIGAVAAFAIASPAVAQVPYSRFPQPAAPTAAYYGSSWGSVAPTPEDAYRQGLISRWDLERLEGPLPQALQGPNPNSTKGEELGQ